MVRAQRGGLSLLEQVKERYPEATGTGAEAVRALAEELGITLGTLRRYACLSGATRGPTLTPEHRARIAEGRKRAWERWRRKKQ
jgi:hypothetical protein